MIANFTPSYTKGFVIIFGHFVRKRGSVGLGKVHKNPIIGNHIRKLIFLRYFKHDMRDRFNLYPKGCEINNVV